jgi:hypothetical protein
MYPRVKSQAISEVYPRATAPVSLEHRYLLDNVLLDVVPLTELGVRLGVPTSIMGSIVELASALLTRDMRSEGTSRAACLDELLLDTVETPRSVGEPVV